MTNHLTQRAQSLIEAFEEGVDVRHGLANVLLYLSAAWYVIHNDDIPTVVRCSTLEDMAAELTAPTLMERALAGDRKAAQQFLQELGLIDEHGQLTGPYKSEQTND